MQIPADNLFVSLKYIPVVYAAGVFTSFTPCVYPLVPVVAGVIGAATDKKFKGFIFSLIYITGISFTYALLGVGAALAGTIFGLTSQSHPVNIVVGGILIIFGLAMLDIINIPLPGFKGGVVHKHSPGWVGILILGMVSGLVAAPCSTPVLGSILALTAANTESIISGGVLLFIYGLGVGTLLILVGTFSSLTANLPKSGAWMNILKKIFGIIIVLSGVYFLVFKGLGLF